MLKQVNWIRATSAAAALAVLGASATSFGWALPKITPAAIPGEFAEAAGFGILPVSFEYADDVEDAGELTLKKARVTESNLFDYAGKFDEEIKVRLGSSVGVVWADLEATPTIDRYALGLAKVEGQFGVIDPDELDDAQEAWEELVADNSVYVEGRSLIKQNLFTGTRRGYLWVAAPIDYEYGGAEVQTVQFYRGWRPHLLQEPIRKLIRPRLVARFWDFEAEADVK